MNEKILYKELSYQLVGCFYEVYNQLGPGYKEIIYHNALAIELKGNHISFEEERHLLVEYKGKRVGMYVPDFIVDEKILVEVKAVEIMPKLYEVQLYHYLKATPYTLGYMVNFAGARLDIRRRVYDTVRVNSR